MLLDKYGNLNNHNYKHISFVHNYQLYNVVLKIHDCITNVKRILFNTK